MLSRERPRAPAFLQTEAKPVLDRVLIVDSFAPAPLPSLRDALQRRAALFGPVEAEPAPAALHGPWHAIGDLARRVVDMLTPPRALA